jgi:hypothetical protein
VSENWKDLNFASQAAIQVPARWGEISAVVADTNDVPLFVGGSPVEFVVDDLAAAKAEQLSPASPGHYWVGFRAPISVGQDEGFVEPRPFHMIFSIAQCDTLGPEILVTMGSDEADPTASFCIAEVNQQPVAVAPVTWSSMKASYDVH